MPKSGIFFTLLFRPQALLFRPQALLFRPLALLFRPQAPRQNPPLRFSWLTFFCILLLGGALHAQEKETGATPAKENVAKESKKSSTPAESVDVKTSKPASKPTSKEKKKIENLDVEAAVAQLLDSALEPARIAVTPIDDDDKERAKRIENEILRAILDAELEAVTPAIVERKLAAQAEDAAKNQLPSIIESLAADHFVVAEVSLVDDKPLVSLRLVHVKTSQVLKNARATLNGKAIKGERSIRSGMSRLVEDVVTAMGKVPGDLRYQRLAVMPFAKSGDAIASSNLDLLLQAELADNLRDRGFLLVERERLNDAIEEMSVSAAMADIENSKIGGMLDVQGLVYGSVAEVGDAFQVTLRVVAVKNAEVIGTSTVRLHREGTVRLNVEALETRTAGEALFRSILAPGWGQAYNQKPVKGLVFSTLGYGSAAVTVGLGIGSALSWMSYVSYVPDPATPAALIPQKAEGLRTQANLFLTATAISAVITGVVWSLNVGDAFLDAY